MSIWGKILGGAAGFALGGPLGALIGAVAGHAVDAMARDTALLVEVAADGTTVETEERPPPTQQIAFTIGVIALGAKMAKADGRVTPEEIRAFREVFQIPPEEMKNVGRLFDQARRDAQGYEPYARQLGRLFQQHPAVLEQLMDGLFHIARADGKVGAEELLYLESVARLFGLSDRAWLRIKAANLGSEVETTDPYAILGVTDSDDEAAVKARHRKLVLEHHPDRLVASGMPPEFVAVAEDKLAKINAAYDELKRRKGWR
jgi:DnaJ like chaperone protein